MTANTREEVVLLPLRVHPNARHNEVIGFTGGVLQVRVAAPPVEGKANRELIAFFSKALDVSKSSLSIVKGLTSHNKVMAVSGLSVEEVITRLPIKPSSGGATRQNTG